MNLPTLITIARFPLLIVIVLLLYFGGAPGRFVVVPLTVLIIAMDALDGIVARRRGEETLLGSVLDIAADRAVEIIFWVVYAHIGLISMIVPITFIIRGALTDSVREVGYARGQSAHAQITNDWGHWIVAGRPMRAGYGFVKAAAFTTLALTLALETVELPLAGLAWLSAQAFSWISVLLCIVRGVPVVYEAFTWERNKV
ncbi:MAG: CDP-alcohol phosphatidyltransferase family protein [Caldilineaceae bacterium]|nr:CDP-alcohol phosphatidyltransferase family protein [Caldilineaceae bacterium]